MKPPIKKLKDEICGYEYLDIRVETMTREDFEKLFEYFKEANFEIKYFKNRPKSDDVEIRPEALFPLGPDDLSWDYVQLHVNALNFHLDYNWGTNYLFLGFVSDDISNLAKARSLAKILKELALWLDKTVEIRSSKLDTVVASFDPDDGYLKFYPHFEKIDVKTTVTKKTKKL